MRIKLFTISAWDNEREVGELNRFLGGNKIIDVESRFVSGEHGVYWCFCVRYLEKSTNPGGNSRTRVDYKQVLDEATFQKFSKLREIRKMISVEQGLPAYAVLTDEELAGLAKLERITVKSMRSIKGIGDKKVDRFARYFITEEPEDEASGTSD